MIYLSGAITSRMDTYKEEFGFVASVARMYGHEVFNPAEQFGGETDLARSTYMRHDFTNLVKCTEIWMLPHWEKSEGARLELIIATQIDLQIRFVEILHHTNELRLQWVDSRSIYSFVRVLPFSQSMKQEFILEK